MSKTLQKEHLRWRRCSKEGNEKPHTAESEEAKKYINERFTNEDPDGRKYYFDERRLIVLIHLAIGEQTYQKQLTNA